MRLRKELHGIHPRESYTWGNGDTASTIASQLATKFASDPAASATASGATLTLTSRSPGNPTYYATEPHANGEFPQFFIHGFTNREHGNDRR